MRHLVVVEKWLKRSDCLALLKSAEFQDDPVFLLLEDPSDRTLLSESGLEGQNFSQCCSGKNLDDRIASVASEIFERLIDFVAQSRQAEAFTHQGVSLLQSARMPIEYQVLFRSFEKCQALLQILGSGRFERISLIGSHSVLLPLLKNTLTALNLHMDLRVFRIPQSAAAGNWKGRLEQRLTRYGLNMRMWSFLARRFRLRSETVSLFGETPERQKRILAVFEPVGWSTETMRAVSDEMGPETAFVAVAQKWYKGEKSALGSHTRQWNWSQALTFWEWGKILSRMRRIQCAWANLSLDAGFRKLFHYENVDLWRSWLPCFANRSRRRWWNTSRSWKCSVVFSPGKNPIWF
jgi:hypothetical protein